MLVPTGTSISMPSWFPSGSNLTLGMRLLEGGQALAAHAELQRAIHAPGGELLGRAVEGLDRLADGVVIRSGPGRLQRGQRGLDRRPLALGQQLGRVVH